MYVVLDSNIIIANYKMDGRHFKDLFNYLKSTGSRLIVPDIVFLEVLASHQREYRKAITSLKRLKEQQLDRLGSMIFLDAQKITSDAELDISNYGDYLNEVLEMNGLQRLKIETPPLHDMINRVVWRWKPFKESGAGLGDLLVWYTVKHCVVELGETAFISGNYKDFGDPGRPGKLHPKLADELKAASNKLNFYQDIQSFLEQQLEKFEEVDVDYVRGLPYFHTIEEHVTKAAEASTAEIEAQLTSGFEADVKLVAGKPQLESFYMYRKTDQNFTLVMRFSVEASFAIEYSHVIARIVSTQTVGDSTPRIQGRAKLQVDVNCDVVNRKLTFVSVLDKKLIRHTYHAKPWWLNIPEYYDSDE